MLVSSLRLARRSRALFSTFKSPHSITVPTLPLMDYVVQNWSKHADKVAIIDAPSGRKLKYSELLTQIGSTAKGMADRGVKMNDVIGIHMPNCPEYVSAFQAIASLGAISTTSNPLYTASELGHQFADAKAKFVITIPPFYETVKAAAAHAGTVQDIWVLGAPSGLFLSTNEGIRPRSVAGIDPLTQIAVLPYSSGTTGLPKGTMLSHSNLTANVEQISAHPTLNAGIKHEDVTLGLLPMYHIYGMTLCTVTCMRLGATLVTLPKFDPPAFLEALQKYKVSYAALVPPIINFLARHPLVARADLSALKTAFSGAAPLDAETQGILLKRFPALRSAQGYGMTELSPVSHIPHIDKTIFGSVGQTVPSGESKIIDITTGALLPAGPSNTGELCFRGPNVMIGYLNNPQATKKTIIDGWVHTGDVAWRDEDGNVFIVDRLKELIKCKGFQVAPAELEGLLLEHPLLADAAVVGKDDARHGEVPIAFVVKKRTAFAALPAGKDIPDVTEEEVKKFIAAKTAEYKHLSAVIFLDAIPKLPSGKILRRVLREKLKAQTPAGAPTA